MKELIGRLYDMSNNRFGYDHQLIVCAIRAIESQAATIARYETTAENYELLQAKVDEQARHMVPDGNSLVPTVKLKQLLADTMTSAGLVSHGKKSRDLGSRLGAYCMEFYQMLAAAPSAAPAPGECVAVDGLRTAVLEAFTAYERFGTDCVFEGMPMIHASVLEELAEIAQQGKAVGDE